MAYGLTPYDKKRYKQSKKRRRQAYYEEKTGRIIPASNRKRKVFIFMLSLLITTGAVVGLWFAVKYFITNGSIADTDFQNSNKEILLSVVNKRDPLESSFVPETQTVNDIEVAEVAATDLEEMLEAAANQNITLALKSGYVSYEEQQVLYENKLAEYQSNPDFTQVRAEAAAANEVPPGGMSESQTGLLVEFDVTDDEERQWLENNCVYYGFVLRYPKNKEEITSKEYNASLYRYTGKENSVKMRSFGMCLEEYNEYISAQNS